MYIVLQNRRHGGKLFFILYGAKKNREKEKSSLFKIIGKIKIGH
jgi:hypothetical protein